MKKVNKIIEDEILPEEVVLLNDACEIIMKNACIAIGILHDISFCESCHGKRE